MKKTFETEVLTRLAVIEGKLDGYQSIKEKGDAGEPGQNGTDYPIYFGKNTTYRWIISE